jgi:arsenate reductase (thioredoxin)
LLRVNHLCVVAQTPRCSGTRSGCGCGLDQTARAQIEREAETLIKDTYNVLFLCTGNSARSIMADAILNYRGRPRFKAYSAGSHPTGRVRPEALRELELAHLSTADARSKSWDEFAQPGAPVMDLVFTVCDNAAKEVCPIWPGQPTTAHWGIADPAAVVGTEDEVQRAFREAFVALDRRIGLFLSLPLQSLDRLAIQKEIDRIGKQ